MYVNVEDGLSCCAAAVDTNVVSVWGHLLVKHFLAFIQDFKNSQFFFRRRIKEIRHTCRLGIMSMCPGETGYLSYMARASSLDTTIAVGLQKGQCIVITPVSQLVSHFMPSTLRTQSDRRLELQSVSSGFELTST